jgi:ABC-type polysaccharide/polyol phosphate transport system ATPase subunit
MKNISKDKSITFEPNFFVVSGAEVAQTQFEFDAQDGYPCVHFKNWVNAVSTIILELTYIGETYLFFLNNKTLIALKDFEVFHRKPSDTRINIQSLLPDAVYSRDKGILKIIHTAGGADADVQIETIHINEQSCMSSDPKTWPSSEGEIKTDSREVLLDVSNVSVSVENRKGISIKSLLPQISSNRNRKEILAGANFDVRAGELVGLIGHNGSGKSTLLRALVGAIGINSGAICARERPLLLRPGFGFREEFNAKLNTVVIAPFLNRTYSYMRAKTSDILEFAGVTASAEIPFRYFSDGMKARLIFATALEAKSSILLMDEIMSAGDLNFRNKVVEGIKNLISTNGAGVMASHDLSFILENCKRCVVVENGKQLFFGPSIDAINIYLALSAQRFYLNSNTKINEK